MAPEIVSKKEYSGPPADIWALGVLTFALLHGCFPFKGQGDGDLYKKIQRGIFTVGDHVSDEAKNMFYRIFRTDPTKRPTAH